MATVESDYELTDDQRQALLEIEKLEHGVDDDADYDYGSMPDYSETTSRLKEINEQWENEPLPKGSSRVRMVEFSSDIEAREAPAVEYESEGKHSDSAERLEGNRANTEEGGFNEYRRTDPGHTEVDNHHPHKPQNESQISIDKSSTSNDDGYKTIHERNALNPSGDYHHNNRQPPAFKEQSNSDNIQQSNKNNSNYLTNQRQTEHLNEQSEWTTPSAKVEIKGQANQSANNNSVTTSNADSSTSQDDVTTSCSTEKVDNHGGAEERILIEINGKFEYLSIEELQARGYPLPGDYTPRTASLESETDQEINSRPRPVTSSGTRSTPQAERAVPRQRAQSATHSTTHRGVEDYAENYISPYGLTKEQRELKERREKLARERTQMHAERKREEEKRKREENESAFQWWLQKKEEDRKEAGNQPTSEEDRKARHEENEKSFKVWMDGKKEQQKHERLLKSREQREREDAYFIRTREECEKAYKQWLKNKWKEQNRVYYGTSSAKSKGGKRRKLKIKAKSASASSSTKSSNSYAYKF